MSGELTASTPAKDWHSSKHIGKRARHLLEHPDEEIPSDATFLVGDGQSEPPKTFKCHKFVLAMVSSMFQSMFYGRFPQPKDIVKVPDVTPVAFQNMLRYAYGENVEFDDESLEEALDTLYCAKMYLIDKLARTCRDHIQLQIVAFEKDPCVVFQRAPQMDEDDLAALALNRIALTSADVMKGNALPRLSFDCLKRIVDYVHLNAKEAQVYQGVCRWMEHNVGALKGSALREAFGTLLHSIRFPLFTATELADGPVADGLLTSDESSSIFQFLFAQTKPTLTFIPTPRSPLAAPLHCFFELVTAPDTALLESYVSNTLLMDARPDVAPECCALLRQLVKGRLHIRIASHDNKRAGRTVPLPTVVTEERNALSHSAKGACWFEWDVEAGATRNVRIGVGRKPHLHHSAVFGFVLGLEDEDFYVPFHLWDDKRIQGVADFRIS